MGIENTTIMREFILIGLSDVPEIEYLLFMVFLFIYVVTVTGNLAIILTTKYSPNLHTPMYFHLSNFSFLEICYVSNIAPELLSNLVAENKTISFYGCVIQTYCFLCFAATECCILAAMAYDRYNALCHPLLYLIIMNSKTCKQLITGSWLIGAVNATVHTPLTFTLPFCGANKIDHFICEIPHLLKLACTDTWINELTTFTIGGFIIVGSLLLILFSYTCIISTILNIRSTLGRKKAFSTCTSHLTVVTIYYGSGIFMYLKPRSRYAVNQDKLAAIMYTAISPLLNPFIYSFRNNDVKIAFRKVMLRVLVGYRN